MNEYQVQITSKAISCIQDLYYYTCMVSWSQIKAESVVREIMKSIHSLESFPYRIKPMEIDIDGDTVYRKLIIKKYSVIFEIREQTIIVVAVIRSNLDIEKRLRNILSN